MNCVELIKGLTNYMEWLWENEMVSSISFEYENNQEQFFKNLSRNGLLLLGLPSYLIYSHMKSIYDLSMNNLELSIFDLIALKTNYFIKIQNIKIKNTPSSLKKYSNVRNKIHF